MVTRRSLPLKRGTATLAKACFTQAWKGALLRASAPTVILVIAPGVTVKPTLVPGKLAFRSAAAKRTTLDLQSLLP